MVTSATQTVSTRSDLTESDSSGPSTRRGPSGSRWSHNPVFRGLLSPMIDVRWSSRGKSPTGGGGGARSNGLGIISRFTRSAAQSDGASR
ncbi:unnamed protein product [Echinostoma caproni]|uniref:Uncharacterized protein n=1 Tax=Echinostoma caproni TaxID=27848 RepID=A0A183BFC3_9TREM|nr:unnamed protein product [Echinostoma caproni]